MYACWIAGSLGAFHILNILTYLCKKNIILKLFWQKCIKLSWITNIFYEVHWNLWFKMNIRTFTSVYLMLEAWSLEYGMWNIHIMVGFIEMLTKQRCRECCIMCVLMSPKLSTYLPREFCYLAKLIRMQFTYYGMFKYDVCHRRMWELDKMHSNEFEKYLSASTTWCCCFYETRMHYDLGFYWINNFQISQEKTTYYYKTQFDWF